VSDPTYSFLPWLRSGVGNSIEHPDGDGGVFVRAAMPIDLTLSGTKLDGSPDDRTIHRDVKLYGPGDVVGIESKAVFKVEPHNRITNFEPNYLPYVEFYDEDFPWRYTPAAADVGKHRLRPWITLVVLKDSEFTDGKDLTGKPLAYIELAAGVNANEVFPKPAELWAWAHVHANVDLSDAGTVVMPDVLAKLQATIAKDADAAYSRLMCPRRLQPETGYHAFVIPTFETGRLSGLGLAVPPTTVATASAWDSNQKQFPYYYRWSFHTSDFGDFEYLVRLLKPRPADKRVGVRDIDVLHTEPFAPPVDTPADLKGVLKLGGALRVPLSTMAPADRQEVAKYDEWDLPFPHEFETAMAALIDLADDYSRVEASAANPGGDPDPVITPPLYGRWPAMVKRVLKAPDGTMLPNNQNWIHRLNLDPRFRVAAGLGTEVVQQNDQKYMNAAWQQVGDVLAANGRLKYAQLAVAASGSLYDRHLVSLPQERQFLLTAPVHSRVMGSPTTVAAQVRASVVPEAVTSGAFRRITRPGATLTRRLGLAPDAAARIVTRINAGELVAVPPKLAPDGALGLDDAVDAVKPAGVPDWLLDLLKTYAWLPYLLFLLFVVVIVLLAVLFAPLPLALGVAAAAAAVLLALLALLRKWIPAAKAAGSIDEKNEKPSSIDGLPKAPDFVISKPGDDFTPHPGAADSVEGANFKAALRDLYTFTSIAYPQPERTRLDLPGLTGKVVAALDPRVALPRRIKQILHLPPWLIADMVEEFVPVMVYPKFETPMYKPLSDLSSELFLPNISLIPANSLTLLESNQRFIEAYMVGLNHEMARELLWNEYPTDQRGSYFRQFWDIAILLPPNPSEGDREKLRDIPRLHEWSRFSPLGAHNARAANGADAQLVLVIRGELLKRYPTAVIYAQKARWQEANGAVDTSKDRLLVDIDPAEEDEPPHGKVRLPLFEAKVDPDIYFIGFDLDALEAKGDGTAANPGWFFVIKERPGEPRFGLDDVPAGQTPRVINWNDLAWANMGVPSGGLIELNKTIPLTAYNAAVDFEDKPDPADAQAQWDPNVDAAELAYILYRVPVLVAVHASRMLP
jgi:hypothetical protein